MVFFSGDWVAHPDSISDLGRIIDMFLNAVKLCHAPAKWQERHLPTVESIGGMLLRLRSAAPKLQNSTKPTKPAACVYGSEQKMTYLKGNSKGGKAPTLAAAKLKCDAAADCGGITEQYGDYECRQSSTPAAATPQQPASSWPIVNAAAASGGPATAGLIIGAPEHDFSSDKTHYYYNNNVWSLYAMEEFGKFLTATDGPSIGKNVTLGQALVADAAKFRVDLARSIKTCTVRTADGGAFLPVYGTLNATPPVNMHVDAASSYAK